MRDQFTPRTRSTFARRFVLSAALGAGLLALAASPSYGRATVGSFESVTPFSETITNYPCFEGVPAHDDGHGDLRGAFHRDDVGAFQRPRHRHDRLSRRPRRWTLRPWTGGEHFGFRVNINRPRTTETGTQQERAILYAADGQELGTITVHVTTHVTYADENGNFEPDPGEITTSFERFNVSCP